MAVHYNTNARPLDGLIGEFGADKIQKIQADLGSEEEVIRVLEKIVEGRFGPVQATIVNHVIYLAKDVPVSRMSLMQ